MKVAAVVLAAGMSRRMAPRNKLLVEDARGIAMVGRVAQAVCGSGVDEVVVVLGHQAAAVEAAVRRAVGVMVAAGRVRFVVAAGFAAGMSVSLRAGLGALGEEVGAALVCLGDMPLVRARVMDAVLGAYRAGAIVVPVHGGRRGNPVLWDRRYFAALAEVRGDVGGRAVLGACGDTVIEVEAEPGVLVDFDTETSLAGDGEG